MLRLRDSDIIHIYHVRGALEGLAARLVAERRMPLQDLELALSQMGEAVQTGDLRKVIDRVQQFHVCRLGKPGSPFILEYGRRLVVPLYAFTLMRALAKNLDAGPWAQQLPNHQRIISSTPYKMGNPWLAEQVVIHVTNLFLESDVERMGPLTRDQLFPL